MSVFSPMDSWIRATGRTDEWLSLGLELLDRWQSGTGPGQDHLAAVLAALGRLRPDPPVVPDPLVVAVWYHHWAGPTELELSATAAYDRLTELGEPDLAAEVCRLVRALGAASPEVGDAALLQAAHLAARPPVTPAQ